MRVNLIINQRILKRALKKAVEGGWYDGQGFLDFFMNEDGTPNKEVQLTATGLIGIFSHDFAQAFWGKSIKKCTECLRYPGEKPLKNPRETRYRKQCARDDHSYVIQEKWKNNLQEMVVEKNPFDYLKKFLE